MTYRMMTRSNNSTVIKKPLVIPKTGSHLQPLQVTLPESGPIPLNFIPKDEKEMNRCLTDVNWRVCSGQRRFEEKVLRNIRV